MAIRVIIHNILPSYRLTPRQYEIALMVMDGMKYKAIAKALGISVFTVRNLIQQAYCILNISSKSELALVLWWDSEGRFKEQK